MKKYVYSIFFIALLAVTLPVQSQWKLNFGGNIAKFQDERTENHKGKLIGLSYVKFNSIYRKFSVESGILYTKRSADLFDKFYYYGDSPDNIKRADVKYTESYLEIPIIFSYNLRCLDLLCFKIGIGPSLILSLKNEISEKRLGSLFDDYSDIDVDYQYTEPGSLSSFRNNSGLDLQFCFGIKIWRLNLDYKQSFAFHKIKNAGGIEINEKLNSSHILLGIDI